MQWKKKKLIIKKQRQKLESQGGGEGKERQRERKAIKSELSLWTVKEGKQEEEEDAEQLKEEDKLLFCTIEKEEMMYPKLLQ